jgi:hypothetical protein
LLIVPILKLITLLLGNYPTENAFYFYIFLISICQ